MFSNFLLNHKQVTSQHLDYADKIVSTINPAVLPDGSDVDNAPPAQTNPHVCNKPYAAVQNFNQDLIDLIATCQRHTRCSASYCLRTKNGQQKCRFGYPQPLQPQSCLITEEDQPKMLTARNDGLINSHNPVQLSAWRANVDMQYIVSRHRVLQSTLPSVNHVLRHSRTSLLQLSETSGMTAPLLSEQRKGYSSAVWVTGTTLLRKPAI